MSLALQATKAAVLLLLLALADAGKPPIYCPRDDKVSDCMGNAVFNIIKTMKDGDPANHIPKLDPVRVPVLPMNTNAGEIMNINLTLFDTIISETTREVTLKSSKFDWDKMDLEVVFHRPAINFAGRYKLNGKILWLPVWGAGTSTLRMIDVIERFHMLGERKAGSDGKDYWHIVKYHSTLEPNLVKVHFNNLFNGNWILGQGANALMNKQWKILYDQLRPITEFHYTNILRPHWDEILRHIPLDEALPPGNKAAKTNPPSPPPGPEAEKEVEKVMEKEVENKVHKEKKTEEESEKERMPEKEAEKKSGMKVEEKATL